MTQSSVSCSAGSMVAAATAIYRDMRRYRMAGGGGDGPGPGGGCWRHDGGARSRVSTARWYCALCCSCRVVVVVGVLAVGGWEAAPGREG